MSTASSTNETDATLMNSWLCNNSKAAGLAGGGVIVANALPRQQSNNNQNDANKKCSNNKPARASLCRSAVGVLAIALLFLINISCATCARDHLHKQTHLEAKVGSHVVFNCPINFPYDVPIEYLVIWSKEVS